MSAETSGCKPLRGQVWECQVMMMWGPRGAQVDLGVDLDSRVAIVGPNGAGKSTLLKLMTGGLEPLDGMVKRHNHLKIGMYHQHLTELLDPKLTPLEYMVRPWTAWSSGTTTSRLACTTSTSPSCSTPSSRPSSTWSAPRQLPPPWGVHAPRPWARPDPVTACGCPRHHVWVLALPERVAHALIAMHSQSWYSI